MEGRKQTSILSHLSASRTDVPAKATHQENENEHLHAKSLKSVAKDAPGSERKSLKTIQLTKQVRIEQVSSFETASCY